MSCRFLFSFSFRPTPSLRVLSCLRASISPPPPGRGICERVIDLRLRAGWWFACVCLSFVSLTPPALVRFRLACGSGFHPVSHFPLLAWSGLVRLRLAPSSLLPVFPVPCVSCFVLVSHPRLIRRVRSARRPYLPTCPRLGDSVAVPCHPIGEVPCFSPPALAFRLLPGSASRLLSLLVSSRSPSRLISPSPAPVVGLLAAPISVSFRSRGGHRAVLPRSALRPALLVGGRGGWAWRVLSSRVARCSGCRSLASLGSRGARLIRLLACRLGILRGRALPLAWRVVAAFPPSPVARAVCLCG